MRSSPSTGCVCLSDPLRLTLVSHINMQRCVYNGTLDYPLNKSPLRPQPEVFSLVITEHYAILRQASPRSLFSGWHSDFEHLPGLVGGLGHRLQRTAMQMMPVWAAECVEAGFPSGLIAHLWTLAADAVPRRLCSDPGSMHDSEPESALTRDLGGRRGEGTRHPARLSSFGLQG